MRRREPIKLNGETRIKWLGRPEGRSVYKPLKKGIDILMNLRIPSDKQQSEHMSETL
jgi:hypothetical protein